MTKEETKLLFYQIEGSTSFTGCLVKVRVSNNRI